MINIFYFPADIYVFTTNDWFSSNFDSLEQLIDVGLDDSDKVPINLNPRLDREFQDAVYLGSVENFEDFYIEYPEYFI